VSKTDARRRDLRARLIAQAEQRIAAEGLAQLRARDLAQDAGCALGTIYTIFADLTELVLCVNARTFARLGQAVSDARQTAADAPVAELVAMAQAYHQFAAGNRHLWRALFDIDRPAGHASPDWYLQEMGRLFAVIDAPLTRLNPDLPEAERALLTRALFSSVHGIVRLSLDDTSAGLPPSEVDRMLALILERFAR